jgi:hypothetical protein
VTTLVKPETQYEARKYRADQRADARKKRVQAALTGGSAAAALTAAGLVSAGKLRKIPKLTEAGYVTSTASGALGALSGFNFARNMYRDAKTAAREGKRSFPDLPQSKPVKKAMMLGPYADAFAGPVEKKARKGALVRTASGKRTYRRGGVQQDRSL